LFGKVKGKDSTYLTYALCFEAVWGNECIMPDILNLVTSQKALTTLPPGKETEVCLGDGVFC